MYRRIVTLSLCIGAIFAILNTRTALAFDIHIETTNLKALLIANFITINAECNPNPDSTDLVCDIYVGTKGGLKHASHITHFAQDESLDCGGVTAIAFNSGVSQQDFSGKIWVACSSEATFNNVPNYGTVVLGSFDMVLGHLNKRSNTEIWRDIQHNDCCDTSASSPGACDPSGLPACP